MNTTYKGHKTPAPAQAQPQAQSQRSQPMNQPQQPQKLQPIQQQPQLQLCRYGDKCTNNTCTRVHMSTEYYNLVVNDVAFRVKSKGVDLFALLNNK